MSAATPDSHERSSTDGPETRPESATAETGPLISSAMTGPDLSPTEPADDDDTDADLIRLLAPPTDPAALGRLAHYEIIRRVGRGGMGRVFQAFDTALQRNVAVKILAAPLAASPMARRRFLREARAAAALNHPNIVTVHAVGEFGSIPYLVMEYVGGGSLSVRLRASAPLPPGEVIRLGAQVAHGLAAAHAQGLVHRDIKPANLLLDDATGRIKITDFGLAQATLDPSESASPGQTAGTPSFLAPELLVGVPATSRSDLFSLGCVLYAMVDGGSPFRGTQFLEVATRLASDTPVSLERLDPRIPPALAALVAGLLEKSPEARHPGTAAEVAARL
ncbi:MAG: serine/threonine-protein kinase, partial [Isosphaeraceae bacterium]|nr:serine/threonine-protein kinase [Isosphaeraceae bacterium]